MTDIIGSLRVMVGKLIMFVVTTALITLVVILAPVLAIVVPLYVIHTGDVDNISLLSELYLLLAPLSAAFWFSAAWKGMRKDPFIVGLVGAAGRMFLGFILSFAGIAVVGTFIRPVSAIAWFVSMYIAAFAPVIVVVVIKLAVGSGPKCVCNGRKCYDPNCSGRIKRGFCTGCNMDCTVVA
jgi:hypothetical protein